MAAASENEKDLTVNAAEYRGGFLRFDLLDKKTRGRPIICGDPNMVIRQMRRKIN